MTGDTAECHSDRNDVFHITATRLAHSQASARGARPQPGFVCRALRRRNVYLWLCAIPARSCRPKHDAPRARPWRAAVAVRLGGRVWRSTFGRSVAQTALFRYLFGPSPPGEWAAWFPFFTPPVVIRFFRQKLSFRGICMQEIAHFPLSHTHKAAPGWVWWCGAAISRDHKKHAFLYVFSRTAKNAKMAPFSLIAKVCGHV